MLVTLIGTLIDCQRPTAAIIPTNNIKINKDMAGESQNIQEDIDMAISGNITVA